MLARLGAAAFIAMTLTMASNASTQDPHDYDWTRGLSARQFCGGELPGWGRDACGQPERQHGYGSCWRRLPYRLGQQAPRFRWICG
jgi:hypothetical protein